MFQGTIIIRNGIIEKAIEGKKSLTIIVDGEKYEFEDSFAFPGFIDSHLHILLGGEFLSMPKIKNCGSANEVVHVVYNNPFYRGNWVFVRGWNNFQWPNNIMPSKEILDEYFPDVPVCLVHNDGHCLWVNSKALEICHITKNTENPKGGLIFRDSEGKPTGILLDNAINLVFHKIPDYSENDLLNFMQNAIKYLASNGITEVDDMDVEFKNFSIYEKYFSNNYSKLKVNIFFRYEPNSLKSFKSFKLNKNEYLSINGFKLYMDGALGSYGALITEPYLDRYDYNGIQYYNKLELKEIFLKLANKNTGLAIHSIGDFATKLILDSYEEFLEEYPTSLPFFRIEHAQLIGLNDISRIKKLKIIPSVQPVHFISDFYMALKRLSKLDILAYPWKSFLKEQIKFICGSDFPIETANPIYGIDALVNRNKYDTEQFFGNEEIKIEEALSAYTRKFNHFKSNFKFDFTSMLKTNITVLNQNLLIINRDKILDTKVIATISNGKVIYQS